MAQIFREITERYNPQIHTEEKSLTVNMNKHFEVKKKTFDLFANKNKFISWLYATGRVNMGAMNGKVMSASSEISDNAYRVQYSGSLFIPAYSAGTIQIGTLYTTDTDMVGTLGAGVTYTGGIISTTVDYNVIGTIAVKHDPANNIFGDKFNEGDVIALGYDGAQLIVMGTPEKASSADHYLVNFKVASDKALFTEASVAEDELLPEAGNRFGEGSMKGYQREKRTKWKINYSFISRASLTMTGSALNQKVAIISSESGAKMWEFEAVLDLRERHAMNLELGARFARSTMDSSTHSWFEDYGTNKLTLAGFTSDYGIVAPVIGDGWIAQLDDSLTVGYDPNTGIPLSTLELFMTILAQRSPAGTTGNTFVLLGDKLGHINIDKAFKTAMGWSNETAGPSMTGLTNIVYNVRSGAPVSVGFEVHEYSYLNNKVIFIEDELMNNPAFSPQNGGIIGTGTIYCLNATPVNGVSNIDLLARSTRALRAKYIDGMHSLDPKRDSVSYAASGFDGGRYDLLSEILPIVYSTESCGILKANTVFTGGALSASFPAGSKATAWHY